MTLSTLGYRTDLFFADYCGEVTDKGDYLVIRTPDNPGYWWGNYLLFKAAPGRGDARKWRELFQKEIGGPPDVKHIVFGWDSKARGVVQPFLDLGLGLERSVIMTAQGLTKPAKYNDEADIRPLATDDDWRAAIDLQVALRDAFFEETSYRLFRQRKMACYRRMASNGLGHWFGAFLEGRLAADLGIFKTDTGLARFQSVETHPEFRRRGLAGSLVYTAGRYALEHLKTRTLVIAADPEYHAFELYASLGFEVVEEQYGLEGRPPQTT